SAAMVWNTKELLPEPETPVKTLRRRLGISTSMPRRLFSRAPWTWMTSCESAVAVWSRSAAVVAIGGFSFTGADRPGGGCRPGLHMASADLLHADHIACRVAECAVAHPPVLVGGFLDHVDVAGLHGGEGRIHVRTGEHEAGEGALGDHLGDHPALLLGDVRIGRGWVEHDVDVRLAGRAHGDPSHVLVADVLTDLEAQSVTVEAQRRLGIGMWHETGVNLDVHAGQPRAGHRWELLDS